MEKFILPDIKHYHQIDIYEQHGGYAALKKVLQMKPDEVIDEVKKLRQGIRRHRDSSLHELCWHHPALWGLLPEKTDPVPEVPEWPEFLRGCVKYRQSLDEQAPHAPRTNRPYEE